MAPDVFFCPDCPPVRAEFKPGSIREVQQMNRIETVEGPAEIVTVDARGEHLSLYLLESVMERSWGKWGYDGLPNDGPPPELAGYVRMAIDINGGPELLDGQRFRQETSWGPLDLVLAGEAQSPNTAVLTGSHGKTLAEIVNLVPRPVEPVRIKLVEALSVQPILTATGANEMRLMTYRAANAIREERDDLKQQVEILTEMHKAACVKHDAMRRDQNAMRAERDVARAVEQELQKPDHLRVGDEVWDQVTRDGPYRIVNAKPGEHGRILVYRGHHVAKDTAAQGAYHVFPAAITKELPPLPPSWWDRHWRKIAIPVAAICGSAALVNGLLAMSANGLLP